MAVVMSPDFTQRGTPAIFPKRLRAQAALQNGAGPSAGAAGLLRSGGCTAFCFLVRCSWRLQWVCRFVGIWSRGRRPCATAAGLYRFAAGRGQPDHPTAAAAIRYHLCKGKGAGSGCGVWGGNCSAAAKKPNNILAIEYLCQLEKLPDAHIQPLALGRIGNTHDGEPVGEFASARAFCAV